MRILDRFIDKWIDDNNLPSVLELGRYAMSADGLVDLTPSCYKTKEGQRIQQELLDVINKDKHDVFEKIAEQVKLGNFSAVPLLQGIKSGLHFGSFENDLEEKLHHIEAIFHAPYSKLTRAVEKVPVSRAKRISNKSNQYLAAHTEDWLHKSLVGFHPSRILTEEIVSNEDVYENQLLIAFVTRAARYLERRLSHTMDISLFLHDYNVLMEKNVSESGWFKRVHRELELAGEVYDEKGSNYKNGISDFDVVGATHRRLKKLRNSLLKLRQFELYFNVDQRKVSSIQLHDTNVLINHQHYRHLKNLWLLLLKEEQASSMEEHAKTDAYIVDNIRMYGLSLVNYVISNAKYLGYSVKGNDTQWIGTHANRPSLSLIYDSNGIINLTIGHELIKFVVTCSIPSMDTEIAKGTYILAYDNSEAVINSTNRQIIPVSLKDVSSAERIAYIIQSVMLSQYVAKLHKKHPFCSVLIPYRSVIESYLDCIKIDDDNFTYIFLKHPNLNVNCSQLEKIITSEMPFKNRSRMEQKDIVEKAKLFVEDYFEKAIVLDEHLRCFDTQCNRPISSHTTDCLNYIKCPCGSVVDSTDYEKVIYYKDSSYSKEEMGMDYIELNMNDYDTDYAN